MRRWASIGRIVGASLAVEVVPLLLPTVANADVHVWHDDTRDSWVIDRGDYPYEIAPAPSHHVGDIVRVLINHTDRAVILRIKFLELKRTGKDMPPDIGDFLRLDGRIRGRPTDAGYWRKVTFQWVGGRDRPHGWAGEGVLHGRQRDTALQSQVDYVRNLIVLRIPRSALGNPPWVRINLGIDHETRDQVAAFIDYAGTAGYNADIYYPTYHPWSPRVYQPNRP